MRSVNNASPNQDVQLPMAGDPLVTVARGWRGWTVVKIVVPLVLLGWLFRHMVLSHPQEMRDLWERPKSVSGLVLATTLVFAAVLISFLRWYLLVAALNLPIGVRQALRLGFMGYFMNFLSAGGVGGDLFKGAVLMRQLSSRRSAALATLFVDRFVGLYALLLLACLVAPLAHGPSQGPSRGPDQGPIAAWVARLPLLTGVVTGLGAVLLLSLGTDNAASRALRRIPWITTIVHDLVLAAHAYRTKIWQCLAALLLSVLTHALVATAHYVLAQSLLGAPSPRYDEHLVMTPLALAAAGIPLTPGGLGTYEVALTYLFDHYPRDGTGVGRGFVVALGYRLQTLLVAAIGMLYCWTQKSPHTVATDSSLR